MMSEVSYVPMENNLLVQRLQSAEKSIAFIQREHAATLTNLHEEIAKWQQKCSELTFQLAIGGGTIINSTDDTKLRSTIEQLENEVRQCKETINNLTKLVEEKEVLNKDYENRLIVNERNHAFQLRQENDKHRQLKIQLEERSSLIAQLTSQLHREKQLQQQFQTRSRLGQILLPNKPVKIPTTDETPTKQFSIRSSSLNHRASPNQDLAVLIVKRRPPTPPQQLRPSSSKSIESNDEQFFSNRQRKLLENHHETIVDSSKTLVSRLPGKRSVILPPIGKKTIPLKALSTAVFEQKGEA